MSLPPHRPGRPLIGASGSCMRKSFAGRPDAIFFLRISREGLFQQPILIATGIIHPSEQNENWFHCHTLPRI